MGGLQLLQTIQSQDCASFVAKRHSEILGGCTFRLHSLTSSSSSLMLDSNSSVFAELLLLGVKKSEQKNGIGTKLISSLKEFIKAESLGQIVTYADWRATGFF